MDLKNITLSICDLCRGVGDFMKKQSLIFKEEQIEVKGLHDFVSYVDKTSEQMIIKHLKELLPEAGFIAEESGESLAERYNWIIDPLDGTTNYLHHIPMYAISIALKEYDEVILGVVYEVGHDECFYSWKGERCFLNDKEIHVSMKRELGDSFVATGFPYIDFTKLDKYIKVLREMMIETVGVRRIGTAATDLAYVAAGRFEVFFEYALKPWDVAAGSFLVKQAGGVVTTFDGGDNYIFGREIVAGNQWIHGKLTQILS